MQAVLLAAGKGNRISDITEGLPKSYLKLNGERLIERNLRLLREYGADEILLVTGYQRRRFFNDFAAPDVRCVFNPFFDQANVLSSFWCALPWLKDDFVFLHADTVFEDSILDDLVRHPGEFVLACDEKPCGDEEMKYRKENGAILQLSKLLAHDKADGEFMGLAKISNVHLPELTKLVESVLERGEFSAFFESAVQDFIDANPGIVQVMDVGDRPWVEIDFPEDYRFAKKVFEKSGAQMSLGSLARIAPPQI